MADAQALAHGLKLARTALENGRNMIETLAAQTNLSALERIEIAYALQSGSYTAARDGDAATAYREELQGLLGPLLVEHDCRSVLDLGAGEGTAWHNWTSPLDHLALVDMSLNRLSWVAQNLTDIPIQTVTAIKGQMGSPPVPECGFDAVVTMHAMEPNGPSARDLVEGAASCAARLLVLFEPDYTNAHDAMKARMARHNYARDIFTVARDLPGFEPVAGGKLAHPVNADNATSYIALTRSNPPDAPTQGQLANPLTRQPLMPIEGGLRDEDGDFVFPMLNGIACLAPGDGVLLGDI